MRLLGISCLVLALAPCAIAGNATRLALGRLTLDGDLAVELALGVIQDRYGFTTEIVLSHRLCSNAVNEAWSCWEMPYFDSYLVSSGKDTLTWLRPDGRVLRLPSRDVVYDAGDDLWEVTHENGVTTLKSKRGEEFQYVSGHIDHYVSLTGAQIKYDRPTSRKTVVSEFDGTQYVEVASKTHIVADSTIDVALGKKKMVFHLRPQTLQCFSIRDERDGDLYRFRYKNGLVCGIWSNQGVLSFSWGKNNWIDGLYDRYPHPVYLASDEIYDYNYQVVGTVIKMGSLRRDNRRSSKMTVDTMFGTIAICDDQGITRMQYARGSAILK